MKFGDIFRRGACRCGSASDAAPLRADAVSPNAAKVMEGPAFGALTAPLDAWRHFQEGAIKVCYTLDGAAHRFHALPPERAAPPAGPMACTIAGIDLGRIADPGHPAHVQAMARMAQHALGVFGGLGFKVPAALTIHLCTFRAETGAKYRGGTEAWLDHVWVSTLLDETEALLTVAHEVFHRVQYEYNPTDRKTTPLYAALREGGARLAEDWVLDSGDRYLKDGIEFLKDPGRPLVHHAAAGEEIAPHSYAAALFWRWLCEQHGKVPRAADGGHEVMRTILERMIDPAGYFLVDLREARGVVFGEGHLDRFDHLDIAAGEILSTETDWGNFLVANRLHGIGRPTPDGRFDYVEDDAGDGAFSRARPFVWPGETLRAGALKDRPFVFEIPKGAVRAGFAARYTEIELDGAAPALLKVDFQVLAGMEDPLVQLLLIRRAADGTEHLHDLIRIDARRSTRFVPTAGLSQVVVIVAAREKPGRYRLSVGAASGRAVLHATPWNAAAGTSYETDPRHKDQPWSWRSPDLAVTGGELVLRVTNRGDAASAALQVTFHAQGTTADVPLRAGVWRAVGDAVLGPIPPRGVGEVRIPWKAPGVPKAATGWGLRATVAGGPDGPLVVLSSTGRLTRPARIDSVL